ncbi:MAG: hypothetical protein KJ674_05050 [Nanoarchaeota archaeon]|nr:hypothetical protein [Nanoarchaeota archaeon]
MIFFKRKPKEQQPNWVLKTFYPTSDGGWTVGKTGSRKEVERYLEEHINPRYKFLNVTENDTNIYQLRSTISEGGQPAERKTPFYLYVTISESDSKVNPLETTVEKAYF